MVFGDGNRVTSKGVCRAVPFTIANHLFHITCYVVPLYSVDVILGVSWLAELGDVTTNWATLSMEFVLQGRQILLRGMPESCISDRDPIFLCSFWVDLFKAVDPPLLLDAILQWHCIRRNGADVEQVLVRWKGLAFEERLWVDVAILKGQLSGSSLEDKAA